MKKKMIAVVGRPNVGKSSFFNYISGKRISIVEDTPGVTRDRIYTDFEWRGRTFTLCDTGGIEPKTKEFIFQKMKRQAELAIELADIILFMVDAKAGVTPQDFEIANLLRRAQKPVLVVVNKVDHVGQMPPEVYEFYNLGFEFLFPISCTQALGMGDLLDGVFEALPDIEESVEEESGIKVAVVGKPNAGKSSLINQICGEERMIVSDVAGTTRDAVDTLVQRGEDQFLFIDTAGIRKKSKIKENIERYSIMRAFSAVDRCDVCVVLIDAVEGVSEQDTKIAGYAHEQGKATLFVVNKWDLIEKNTGTLEETKKTVREKFGFMLYAPVFFISAKTGQRVEQLFSQIKHAYQQSMLRISTGMLNDVLNESIAMVQPPSDKGKRLKVFYITQASIQPPTFIIFVNNKELMHYSYARYLENQLRKNFGFEGTPIKLVIREKQKEKVE